MKVGIYETRCDDMARRVNGLVTGNWLFGDHCDPISGYANVRNLIEIARRIHYPAANYS
jgi:hypothetical protein